MKYWRGFLVAAIIGVVTMAISALAKEYSLLVDMVYPYVSRMILTTLADWSATVDFTLWQVLAVLMIVGLLATIVLMIVLKWNFFQWLGWVMAGLSLLWCVHTGVWGLNNFASPLAEDLRLQVTEYTLKELENATVYFRDKANELAEAMARDGNGDLSYDDFDTLAENAGKGYEKLIYSGEAAVFAGSMQPVKKLEWEKMYAAMGIAGVTMPVTGEAAVNPLLPSIGLPFTMCHEMAHRMAIAPERDANLAAFLGCVNHEDPQFVYSGYFMAYRYCMNALQSVGSGEAAAAAARIATGVNSYFKADIADYNAFFIQYHKEFASDVANTVNDTFIKVSGDESGVRSYGEVCDLLVSWHLQEIVRPGQGDSESDFDPLDKDQVDLSDILEGRE